jgi:hypothetical protein
VAMAETGRLDDLKEFYGILDHLAERVGGVRTLARSSGIEQWPARGVYFFFEKGEERADSGSGSRVVRVGTHALKDGSKTTLWNRLSQHRGVVRSGGGNHRGSVFRLHVGGALLSRAPERHCPTWATGGTASAQVRAQELEIERMVSSVIGDMPFLCLAIVDEPGAQSDRGYIERNSIALLSNFRRAALDAPSPYWLGRHCRSEKVRLSGLWNSNHVEEGYDPAFLERLRALVEAS